MENRPSTSSLRAAARFAGAGYLVIFICGLFAEMVVRADLIDKSSAQVTASNIIESQGLFRLSIASDIVMLIFDAAVGIALFALLRPLGRNIAVLSTAFRLLHTAIYGTTLIVLLVAVELLDGGAALAGLTGDERNALALVFLNAQAYGYLIGLIFFGVHVGVLGYAAVRFGFIPKTIGWLLLVASAGYMTDGFARVLLSNYADYETAFALVVFVPAVIGELSLGLWLLFKGTKSATIASKGQPLATTRLATGS